MTVIDEAQIRDVDVDDFTRITFSPDLKRLCPNRPDQTVISIQDQKALTKRCVDIAGTAGLKVSVNGTELQVDGWRK